MASIFKKTLTIFLMLFVLVAPTAAYERIVSLYPGHTDNIVALGGQSRLVGLSKSDDPSRLPELPRFALNVGAEALLALKPDLVLTRTLVEKQNPELRGVLERAGVPVMLVDPPSWDGFVAYLRALAPLIGVAPQAAEAQSRKPAMKSGRQRRRAAAGVPRRPSSSKPRPRNCIPAPQIHGRRICLNWPEAETPPRTPNRSAAAAPSPPGG